MALQVKYGSTGSDVKKLQQTLNKNGYKLTEDGIFGAKTQAAVKDYQKKNGLDVDGIVGTNTWGALLKTNTTNTTATKAANTTATNTAGTVGTGFEYKDFSYDDFNYDKTYTAPEDFKYDDFQYGAYQESETVAAAKAALESQLANKPGGYQSQWQSQLDDAINKILNREKFSYDLNGDALYQQYKDKYIQQGKMAMADTMGQAAAMTGGYGNSYAAAVGNQAYQASLQQLNDIVPELYQMAYDRYNQEGQDLYNQYAMLGERENMDYSRYRDSVNDWQAERDYLTGRYDSERNFDYSKYADDRNFQYGKYADDRNLAYNQYVDDRNFDYNQYINDRNYEYDKYVNDRNFAYGQYADDKSYAYNDYRNQIEDAQWKANFDEALRQYNEQFAYQKDRDAVADSQWDQSFQYQKDRDAVADSQWDKSFQYQQDRDAVADSQWDKAFQYQEGRDEVADKQWQAEFDRDNANYDANRTENNAKDFYESGGKVGYDNGSVSIDNIKIMQKALGIDADGKWGPGSKEASGGLTADQAWKAYQDGKLGKADIGYDEIASDLDYYISQGATKSEINRYIRDARNSGYITTAEYNKLKAIYAPSGHTY